MRGREAPQHYGFRQHRAIELDYRHVYLATGILALPPHTLSLEVQHHRQTDRTCEIGGVRVEFDFDAVGKVLGRLVNYDVPACHEEQPVIAFKEEAARS